MRRLALLFLVLGCRGAHEPGRDASVTLAPPPAPSAPALAPGPVGLATFEPPPARAIAANDRGVGLLARGEPEQAASELRAALAIAPDFVLARYNLACALARAGAFDDAGKELAAVFDADFVGMRDHALKDADLAAFWPSPAGKRLAALVPSYEARYRAVIDRGVRAILWHDGPGDRGSLEPSLLRVGVFDPDTRRFVAVAPPSPKAYFAFASSLVPYAVVAYGTVRDMLRGDMDAGAHLDRIAVYPLSTSGVPAAGFPVDVDAYFANVALDDRGLRLYTHTIVPAKPDEYDMRFDARFGAPVVRRNANTSKNADELPSAPVSMEIGYSHYGYLVFENDRAWAYAPFTLTLASGKKIAIPKSVAYRQGPARVVASRSGDRAVLVWNAALDPCKHERIVPGRYEMALVDTRSGAVTSLGHGDGAAAASFDARGDLFVQRGARVVEITGGAEHPLPKGVLLVPQIEPDDDCGF